MRSATDAVARVPKAVGRSPSPRAPAEADCALTFYEVRKRRERREWLGGLRKVSSGKVDSRACGRSGVRNAREKKRETTTCTSLLFGRFDLNLNLLAYANKLRRRVRKSRRRSLLPSPHIVIVSRRKGRRIVSARYYLPRRNFSQEKKTCERDSKKIFYWKERLRCTAPAKDIGAGTIFQAHTSCIKPFIDESMEKKKKKKGKKGRRKSVESR